MEAHGRGIARVIDVRSTLLACCAVALAIVAFALGAVAHPGLPFVPILVLGFCGIIAEAHATPLSSRISGSASSALMVLAAVIGGPLAGAAVGVVAQLGDARGPRLRWVVYAGIHAAMGAAAGGAALALGRLSGESVAKVAGQALCAATAAALVNIAGNWVVAVVRQITPLGQHMRMVVAASSGATVFTIPAIAVVAWGYAEQGLAMLVLILIPLLGIGVLLRLYREKSELARTLTEGNMSFALALVRALDARDAHTAGHSAAVAVYARDLARAAGHSPEHVATIQLAALLHDIGKIGISSEILNKPGRLTSAEWLEIRRHPAMGERIAGEAPVFAEIAGLIRHHHECPDGSGYPDGLVGAEIPEASAVIGIADAYNAMTSPRPYRAAMSPEVAIEKLRRGAGTQFDDRMVNLFAGVLEREGLAYRVAEGSVFSLEGQRHAILGELDGRLLVTAAA